MENDTHLDYSNSPLPVIPQTNLWKLFVIWFSLGFQSFGGGASTLIFIHQACLSQKWLNEDEFVRTWALSQITPGVNLLKLTVMIGYHLRGWKGVWVCMAGLLLPSATVTVLMTAGYTAIRNYPIVQAAMRGIIPATIGLSFAMSFQLIQAILSQAYHEGRTRLGVHLLILTGSILISLNGSISPLVVLLVVGGVTLLFLSFFPAKNKPEKSEGR